MDINKIKELEDRIKAPSIWGRVQCGIRFEDLQDVRYEEAVKFLKKHYLNEEITWRSVRIQDDKEGTDEFIHNARIWMKDKMSIAVIKEGKEKLVGVLIMRIQEKIAYSRTFSKVKMTYNPKYATVMQFYNELEAMTNIYKELGVRRYLKIYVVALKARYRHRGITKQLIQSATGLAAAACVPAMSGIFGSGRLQQIAAEIGFRKLCEIYYVRYFVEGEIVFWDTGQGNYSGAVMAYRIPGIVEPTDVVANVDNSSRFKLNLPTEEEVKEEKPPEEPKEEDDDKSE